jgi:tetratricopeptide (TPR) repeat protein
MTTRIVAVALITLALAGCATDINRINATKYFDAGLRSEQSGDFAAARENFWRAWVNARDGGAPEGYKSAVLYNLGRMEGYICNFGQAEALLKMALDMELRVSGPTSGNTSKRYFELARLHFDQGKFAASLPYYEKAAELSTTLKIDQDDPLTVVSTLQEFATALDRSGFPSRSAEVIEQARSLKAKSQAASQKFSPVRYPTKCTQ